jgi:hypothetical protein
LNQGRTQEALSAVARLIARQAAETWLADCDAARSAENELVMETHRSQLLLPVPQIANGT